MHAAFMHDHSQLFHHNPPHHVDPRHTLQKCPIIMRRTRLTSCFLLEVEGLKIVAAISFNHSFSTGCSSEVQASNLNCKSQLHWAAHGSNMIQQKLIFYSLA